MKTSRAVAVGIGLLAIFVCWSTTVQAGPSLWPNNKGEICLQNQGPGPGTGEVARIAVMRTIGNNYIVHGFVTETSGKKTLVNGNAIIEGDQILMNVTSSGFNETSGEAHGFVGRVELDASTLAGQVMGVGFHCNGGCGLNYDGIQQLAPIPCP